MKNHPLHRRALFGLAGMRDGWRREKAYRGQLFALLAAIVALAWFQPPAIWAALLLVSVGVTLAMELMNGAVETLCDHLHADRHEAIRIVKDMSSAAVFTLNIANALLAVWIAITTL